MKTHKHHIIPRHAGGTNDPDNLIELSILDHSAAHKELYERYGRWQDRVAWLSLAGIMKNEERIYEILKNSNPGGYKFTDEQKKKMSISKMGDKNPMYGQPAPNRGVNRPGIGGRKIGTVWSEEERATQMTLRNSNEHKEKMSKVYADPDRNEKISLSRVGKVGSALGKTWFNDGAIETYAIECPIGFVLGRTPKPQPNKKGLLWYTNGIVTRQFKEHNQSEGFVRGRLIKK